MSKKDYEAVARIIASYRKDNGVQDLLEAITHDLKRLFLKDNPRFDCARFLAACGFAEEAVK